MVVARTTEGEIGILPGHAPVLGELASGLLRVIQPGGGEVVAAIHGGFLSVAATGVSVLADIAELADDIDLAEARQALEEAQQDSDNERSKQAVAAAEARIAAVEKAS